MDSAMQPLDFSRMFTGDASLLYLVEIAFRTAFMYVVAVAAAQIIGKRGLGDLTPFEYIVVIAMGATAGTPMMEVNVPLLHGVTVLLVVVSIDALVARYTRHSIRLERLLNTEPALIIRNGKVMQDSMRTEKIGVDELMMLLRIAGVRNISEVELAYLEPSGNLSVFFDEEARFRNFHEADRVNNGIHNPTWEGESTLPKDPDIVENAVQ